MRYKSLFCLAAGGMALFAAGPAVAQCDVSISTGTWRGNDGGTYRFSQSGGEVRWIGRSADGGRSWTNSFRGRWNKDRTISGDWWDAKAPHGRGTMTIKRVDDWTLVRVAAAGSPFGATRWTRKRGCADVALQPVH